MQSISRKKIFFPLNPAFRNYLKLYEREVKLPLSYEELKYYDYGIPVYDKLGKDTLWESVMYPQSMVSSIHAGLKRIFVLTQFNSASLNRHITITPSRSKRKMPICVAVSMSTGWAAMVMSAFC